MRNAELETSIMDAPPGDHPPLTTQPVQEPALTASTQEAVLLNEEGDNYLQVIKNNSVSLLNTEDHNPLYYSPTLASELRTIFSRPVTLMTKSPEATDPENQDSSPRRSLESAVQEHTLVGNLTSRIEANKSAKVVVYRGVTTQNMHWLIGARISEFKAPPQRTTYALNGAASELERRQPSELPNDLIHDKFVRFFAVNWDKLIPIFYNRSVPEGTSMRRYYEVDLNDFMVQTTRDTEPDQAAGVIDFVGELPDGQLITIEFRSPGSISKTRQVARHTRALQEILRIHNGRHDIPRIVPYIGVYEEKRDYANEDYSLVKLLPRYEAYKPYTTKTPKGETVIYLPNTDKAAA